MARAYNGRHEWTPEEDFMLAKAMVAGKSYQQIRKLIPTLTDDQVTSRCRVLLNDMQVDMGSGQAAAPAGPPRVHDTRRIPRAELAAFATAGGWTTRLIVTEDDVRRIELLDPAGDVAERWDDPDDAEAVARALSRCVTRARGGRGSRR